MKKFRIYVSQNEEGIETRSMDIIQLPNIEKTLIICLSNQDYSEIKIDILIETCWLLSNMLTVKVILDFLREYNLLPIFADLLIWNST